MGAARLSSRGTSRAPPARRKASGIPLAGGGPRPAAIGFGKRAPRNPSRRRARSRFRHETVLTRVRRFWYAFQGFQNRLAHFRAIERFQKHAPTYHALPAASNTRGLVPPQAQAM